MLPLAVAGCCGIPSDTVPTGDGSGESAQRTIAPARAQVDPGDNGPDAYDGFQTTGRPWSPKDGAQSPDPWGFSPTGGGGASAQGEPGGRAPVKGCVKA